MAVFPEKPTMVLSCKKVEAETCHIGVQDQCKYWQHCVDGGIADHEKTLVQRHRREVEHGGEDCLHQKLNLSEQLFHKSPSKDLHCGDDKASVYDELAETSRPLVAVSAVDKEQSANMAELEGFSVKSWFINIVC